jgi:hypothetical protein
MSIGSQGNTMSAVGEGIHTELDASTEKQQAQPDAFWRDALAGAPTLTEFPADRPRPSRPNFVSESIEVRIDADLCARLENFARESGGDMYAVLFAAWTAAIGRLSNQRDVVVGSALQTQGDANVLADPLPLRIDLSRDPDAVQLVKQTHEQRRRAAAHGAIGLANIVDALAPTGQCRGLNSTAAPSNSI